MTTETINGNKTIEEVQDYYGKVLKGSKDLKTNACCTADALPTRHKEILSKLDPEILSKFYGCGTPLPENIEGCTILDLGCGTGRDVFLAAALVGDSGKVIGLDMTDEQLEVARRHQESQPKALGLSKSNVEFKQGYIEDLAAAGIADNSVDVVISNCVINLSPDKEAVFREIFRVLKPGGEMYISDVFADRRIPQALRDDSVLYGECLSGALYLEDFRRLMSDIGCADYRQISSSPITIENEAVEAKVGHIRFDSITIRAFKLDLEDRCEDYGEVAYYKGTIEEAPNTFALDDHHLFETGKPMLVCTNTADMVSKTRFGKHFNIVGDRNNHYGLFDCSEPAPAGDADGGCC